MHKVKDLSCSARGPSTIYLPKACTHYIYYCHSHKYQIIGYMDPEGRA